MSVLIPLFSPTSSVSLWVTVWKCSHTMSCAGFCQRGSHKMCENVNVARFVMGNVASAIAFNGGHNRGESVCTCLPRCVCVSPCCVIVCVIGLESERRTVLVCSFTCIQIFTLNLYM